jgi:hypothetical protein
MRMLESGKHWNITSVNEDNITQCTVSCSIIGEQDDRERVRNGEGVIWLKQDITTSEMPRHNLLRYIHFKKWRNRKAK